MACFSTWQTSLLRPAIDRTLGEHTYHLVFRFLSDRIQRVLESPIKRIPKPIDPEVEVLEAAVAASAYLERRAGARSYGAVEVRQMYDQTARARDLGVHTRCRVLHAAVEDLRLMWGLSRISMGSPRKEITVPDATMSAGPEEAKLVRLMGILPNRTHPWAGAPHGNCYRSAGSPASTITPPLERRAQALESSDALPGLVVGHHSIMGIAGVLAKPFGLAHPGRVVGQEGDPP